METERKCTGCHKTQPIEEYRFVKKGNPRRSRRCKGCLKEYSQQYRIDNRKVQNLQHNLWKYKRMVKSLRQTIKELEDGK